MTRIAIVVPLKSFAIGKGRLRGVASLDVDVLSRYLAAGVITAAAPRDVFVVSHSSDVSVFATALGATNLHCETPGLNAAVQFAFDSVRPLYDVVVIAHGDLRNPTGLGSFDPAPGVTVVQDHRATGTTVLAVPTTSEFTFQYGDNSCQLHEIEAKRRGHVVRVVSDSPWRFDIDEPEDLQ